MDEDYSGLKQYRRIALLTDGYSTPFLAKTAISLLRYRGQDVVAVIDRAEAGKDAEQLLGVGGEIPVVASLDGVDADAVFIGIAPPGGRRPESWRPILCDAVRRGFDLVSGLHEFFGEDPEWVQLAAEHQCRLIDVRQNSWRQTAQHLDFPNECLRIHTVGQDCSLGKMVVALELQRHFAASGRDARFLATGQTGIMISGEGLPIDCVISDFVSGAAESLVERHQDAEMVFVEGQGSIGHPCFAAVTLGLLHGCAPDGMIFCYEVGRTHVKGLDQVPLAPISDLLEIYERMAALRHPSKVIGIAMNSRKVGAQQAAEEREVIRKQFGLPVCDVFRDGPDELVAAVESLRREKTQ